MFEIKDQNQGSYPQPDRYPSQPGYPLEVYPLGGYPPPPQPGFLPSLYRRTSYEAKDASAPPYTLLPAPIVQPITPPNSNNLGENEEIKNFDFTVQSIMKPFLARVYLNLMCQLVVTTALIGLFMFHQPTKIWTLHNVWIFWVTLAIVVCLMLMCCCGNVHRQPPKNLIFLCIFPLAEGFLVGIFSSIYDAYLVLTAVGVLAVLSFALTIFALQTTFDFTTKNGIFLCIIVAPITFGIVVITMTSDIEKMPNLLFASICALVLSICLLYDTQLMMDGKHKYSISPEEHAFTALNLYLDIVTVYLLLLAIIVIYRNKDGA